MPIPAHNMSGVLPPFLADPAALTARSPYSATIDEFVDAFSTSLHRVELLKGFLGYRATLRVKNFAGFQWIDGSFVEKLPDREPNDIDVVTFFENLGIDPIQRENDVKTLRKTAKPAYKVDGYFVELSPESPEVIVLMTHYWYSLFSHKRDLGWKGMVQIELRIDNDDTSAMLILAEREAILRGRHE